MGTSSHAWIAWLETKQKKDWIERLEGYVLAYNNKTPTHTPHDPLWVYFHLLPYEKQVSAAIEKCTDETQKQDVYNQIINVLLDAKDGGKAVDHHFGRRAGFHMFGYFIVTLLMIGTSATNSSAMYNFLTGEDVGLDFGAYENILKGMLFVSSMMAQWMMYRKAVPEMINKVFSAPNGTWGFLETRKLGFFENNNTFELNYIEDDIELDNITKTKIKTMRIKSISGNKKNNDDEPDHEIVTFDRETAEQYGIWDKTSITIGEIDYDLTKNADESKISFTMDLKKLPNHTARRMLMVGLTVCTVLMVASLGMLVLEKVASLLHKEKEKDGLFGLSEDLSFGLGAFFGILIALGVGLLWKRVLNEKFLERETEIKKKMILKALGDKDQEQDNLFTQFFVPHIKDENEKLRSLWWTGAITVIVGIGLLASMMAQTKNTFGLIDGWAGGDKLPSLSDYDPMNTAVENAGLIIFAFLLFFIVAPASRFIFSGFAVGNLFNLGKALYEACTWDNLKAEVSTYKTNYMLGTALALAVLAVFIYSLCDETWQQPLTSGEHGWKTGEYPGMLTPTGLAILGAYAAWAVFKFAFEKKPENPPAPLLKLAPDSEKRSGQQLFAAMTNALSFGAIGGGGMIFFLTDVLHCPDEKNIGAALILIASVMTMFTLGISSLGTSMQPVRLSKNKSQSDKNAPNQKATIPETDSRRETPVTPTASVDSIHSTANGDLPIPTTAKLK